MLHALHTTYNLQETGAELTADQRRPSPRDDLLCQKLAPKCGMTGMQAVFVSIAMASNRVQHLVPFVADVQSLRYLCG